MKNPAEFLLVVVVLFVHTALWSQETAGARAAGLSGCALILDDTWSGFHNQAGLSGLQGFTTAVYYQNLYILPELNNRGFTTTLGTGRGSFALTYHAFGYSAYTNSKTGLGYGMKLSEKFSIGAQLNYHVIRISEGYGSRQTLTAEGGLMYHMNNHLVVAAHIFNPTNSQLAVYNDEKIPAAIRAAAGYMFSERLLITAQISKFSEQGPFVSAAMEYKFPQHLILRAGMSTQAPSISFGFGWEFGKWQLDCASSFHQVLGFSPQLSMVFQPGNSGKTKS